MNLRAVLQNQVWFLNDCKSK